MDFFKNRYYNINRLNLSIVGLWPYLDLNRRLASVMVFVVIFGTGLLLRVWKMLRINVTALFLIYSFRFSVPSFVIISEALYYFFNAEKMKALLEHIKRDWSLFEPCDLEIIESYAKMIRICNLTVTGSSVVFALIPMLQVSKRSDSGSHSNDTDLIELLIPIQISDATYNYYFPCFMFMLFICTTLASLVIVADITFYLSNIQHACGVLDIAGRRMERMLKDLGNDIRTYKNNIMFHTRAVGFLNTMNEFFGPLYMTVMIFIVVLLSIELFQVTGLYEDVYNLKNNLANFGNFVCVLSMMGFFCYTGQLLIDYNNDVFAKTYLSRWYMAPQDVQKSIIMIMIQGATSSGLTLTKSVAVSFEMLATMLQMSVSYFMAIGSLRH